ncbi:phage shock protein C (PspC) family protein [Variovorax sp. HW608]|uniref:PspC domain-containing protein n=1 Tax=Variovorax sp. HW608 TaxID=1034889 RepID=UPI00081FE56B|nr:PspC domain-containing protein [Variovorax sp. HW608]SCK25493.1 phage shock protein C (PspC) family protein [Variovorax sp. HW608]
MSLSEEIDRLAELHRSGALSDEEFERAKSRLLGTGSQASGQPWASAVNALRRSRSERWIAGVCGGLAQATGLEVWAWRLIFAALFFCGGAGLVVYLLLWIFVPSE